MLPVPRVAPSEEVDASSCRGHSDGSLSDQVAELARSARLDDPRSLEPFLQSIAPLVRRICRGVLGREPQELEDTIQDCLIDVVRALPQYRFDADVSHYITKIVLRRAIRSRKRCRARSRLQLQFDPRTLCSASFDESSDELHAALVRELLDKLNEAQATVLLLRVMLGHTVGEIASITGVPENTVKTRLRLGKQRLRRWFERHTEVSRVR